MKKSLGRSCNIPDAELDPHGSLEKAVPGDPHGSLEKRLESWINTRDMAEAHKAKAASFIQTRHATASGIDELHERAEDSYAKWRAATGILRLW